MHYLNIKKSRIFWMIILAIAFHWAINNLTVIWHALLFMLRMILPIIIGIALVFIIGVFVDIIEEKLLVYRPGKTTYNKLRRPLSVLASVLLVLGFFVLVLVVIVPQIIEALQSLGTQIPELTDRIQKFVTELSESRPQLSRWFNIDNIDSQAITEKMSSFFTNLLPNALDSVLRVTTSVFNVVFNLFLGIIIAIYFLLQRERIVKGMHQILYAFTSKDFTRRMSKLISLTATAIKNFVTGQMIEVINIAVMTYVAMLIFGIPSALLVSFIMGVTSLVPLFGSIIGVAIGFLVVAILDFSQAFWFLLIVIVIIQIESYLIYPKVVGGKTGTPPIIVLLAVTVFGNLFGLIGMIIGVPIAAIVFTLITEAINSRIKTKLEDESPTVHPVRAIRPR